MSFWRNRKTSLISSVSGNNNLGTKLKYNKNTNIMSLITNRGSTDITIPSGFNGKKVVIWLTENSDANVTKASISNYSSTLTQASSPVGNQRLNFSFFTEDGILYRWMYSTNLYDFDSEKFHRIMMQEKLNGSYIL